MVLVLPCLPVLPAAGHSREPAGELGKVRSLETQSQEGGLPEDPGTRLAPGLGQSRRPQGLVEEGEPRGLAEASRSPAPKIPAPAEPKRGDCSSIRLLAELGSRPLPEAICLLHRLSLSSCKPLNLPLVPGMKLSAN